MHFPRPFLLFPLLTPFLVGCLRDDKNIYILLFLASEIQTLTPLWSENDLPSRGGG
ncbi:unnamed protein product [Tuber aestivum]|uniref:Lipoprotein n=1 Tax=Tuber aestivum TaxID=59557 RepID=A0A292Q716_9PEZI|nr:unnamed protein product [Tuber aestivum]